MRGRIQPRRAALSSRVRAHCGTRGLIFCPTCDANGNRLEGEYAAADEKSVFVYAGATAPAYMIRGDVTYRIVTDNQGSVRLVVNTETGEIAQRLDYDSFGRVLCDTNPGFQPFGFQGGLYDPDTGLVEFCCRWYDAETGRWISKDPILLDGGWNVYAFCGNDPINRTDPSGLCEDVGRGLGDEFLRGYFEYENSSEGYFSCGIKPIIINGDKMYPGYRFYYHPDVFGHGTLPDGRAKQPHVDQIPKRGTGKVRFDVKGNPLDGEKGVVPRKDRMAFGEAVKDVLKVIGGSAAEVGVRLISVPILLAPSCMFYQENYGVEIEGI